MQPLRLLCESLLCAPRPRCQPHEAVGGVHMGEGARSIRRDGKRICAAVRVDPRLIAEV